MTLLTGRQIADELEGVTAAAINVYMDSAVRPVAIQGAPVEEGTLRGSTVVDDATPEHLVATMSFNTPYAAAQHEGYAVQMRGGREVIIHFRNHPRGGGDHYLSGALKLATPGFAPFIAKAWNAALAAMQRG